MGGGQGLEFWGAKGGPNSQQAHDVVTTSMRRKDVASTSFRRQVPTRFLINQCQIITFLNLKYDIIENSRIELRGIVLPVQVGGLLGGGGGGPKGMLAPPLKLLGGAGSRLSLSRSRRDPLKYFEISVLRHIRCAELRKIPVEQPNFTNEHVI